MRELSEAETRKRSHSEQEAVLEQLWAAEREKVGTELVQRRNERDALLYQGLSEWKYTKEVQNIDEKIRALEEKLEIVIKNRPIFPAEPKIVLFRENKEGSLPAAPQKGTEAIYCKTNDLDALLLGSVSPYYERTLLRLSLFGAREREIIYEDGAIYSSDSREQAESELYKRLIGFISDISLGALSISAEPAETSISVNGKMLGKGAVGPIEMKPGKVTLELSAPLHESIQTDIDLNEGELTHAQLSLEAVRSVSLSLNTETKDGDIKNDAIIRSGSLYLGQTPLAVTTEYGKLLELSALTEDGYAASVLTKAEEGRLVLELSLLPTKGEKRVETARKKFYNAFGRFSVMLPLAFLASGISQGYQNAQIWADNPAIYDDANRAELLSFFTMTGAAVFFIESVYRFTQYIRVSDARSTRFVRVDVGESRK
ncbi:hypothetical protein MASR2M78_00250 [Treponema sp.]